MPSNLYCTFCIAEICYFYLFICTYISLRRLKAISSMSSRKYIYIIFSGLSRNNPLNNCNCISCLHTPPATPRKHKTRALRQKCARRGGWFMNKPKSCSQKQFPLYVCLCDAATEQNPLRMISSLWLKKPCAHSTCARWSWAPAENTTTAHTHTHTGIAGNKSSADALRRENGYYYYCIHTVGWC